MNMVPLVKYLLVFWSILFTWPAIAAPSTTTLQPSSKWHAVYEDDYCRLVRFFGTEDQKTILSLSKYGPGDFFKMTVGSKAVKFKARRKGMYFQFGPHESPQLAEYFKGTVGTDNEIPAIIFRSNLRLAPYNDDEMSIVEGGDFAAKQKLNLPVARYAAANDLSLGIRKDQPALKLELGSMHKPMAALDTCVDELLTHWGIDPIRHKNLQRPVTLLTKAKKLASSIRYPKKMLFKGKQAIVQFRLSVDESGNATQCHIQRSTRPQEFDDAVCKGLLRVTRFEPALDASGKPTASYWRSAVNFLSF